MYNHTRSWSGVASHMIVVYVVVQENGRILLKVMDPAKGYEKNSVNRFLGSPTVLIYSENKITEEERKPVPHFVTIEDT